MLLLETGDSYLLRQRYHHWRFNLLQSLLPPLATCIFLTMENSLTFCPKPPRKQTRPWMPAISWPISFSSTNLPGFGLFHVNRLIMIVYWGSQQSGTRCGRELGGLSLTNPAARNWDVTWTKSYLHLDRNY